MRSARQFTIEFKDRPGALGELASALWGRGVKIRAFLAEFNGNHGNIHLVVGNYAAARKVFVDQGSNAREEKVLVLTRLDKPGSLTGVRRKLGRAGVRIEYAYSGPARARGKVTTYLAVSKRRKPRRHFC
jgi:hypothetical protein